MPRNVTLARWPAVVAMLFVPTAISPGTLRGQSAPVVDPTLASAGVPVIAPAAPPKLGGGALLSAMSASHAKHKAMFYASPLGKLLVNLRKPLSLMTGGLVQSDSPHSDKYKGAAGGPPPSPAMGAADKIKAEAKQAAERREAVRYLGTVDCHYYPEAEQALIAALRCDRSECVRLEAAEALSKGCCCTKKTMEALKIAVSGSNRDGNPGETSLRVKMTAFEALQNCLANCNIIDAPPAPAQRPEYPSPPLAPQPELPPGEAMPAERNPSERNPSEGNPDTGNLGAGARGGANPASYRYYAQFDAVPLSRVVGEAQQVVARTQVRPQLALGGYATGRRNLLNLWAESAHAESEYGSLNSLSPTPALPPEFVSDDFAAGESTVGDFVGPNITPPPELAAQFDASGAAVGHDSFNREPLDEPSFNGRAFNGRAYNGRAFNRQPSSRLAPQYDFSHMAAPPFNPADEGNLPYDAGIYQPDFPPPSHLRRTPPVDGDLQPVDYQRAVDLPTFNP